MYLSQPVPESVRLPFHRPRAAGFYTPQLPRTGFFSHINPFMNVYPPMAAYPARIPYMTPEMQPGMYRYAGGRATGIQQQLPAVVVPGMTSQTPSPQPRAIPSPVATPQPAAPTPGPTAGFGHSFGALLPNPYRTIRTGWLPGVSSSGANIRQQVRGAGAMIRRLSPYSYPGANVPAGTYAPGTPG